MYGREEREIHNDTIHNAHATRLVCMTVHKSMDHEENTM